MPESVKPTIDKKKPKARSQDKDLHLGEREAASSSSAEDPSPEERGTPSGESQPGEEQDPPLIHHLSEENVVLENMPLPMVVDQPVVLQKTQKATLSRRYDFKCKFTQIVAFKSFFENLGSVLHEVTLEVRSDPGDGYKGLVADSMDSRGVALVHGKLAAQVDLNVSQATFCVIVRDIIDIFPNIHPQHFLEIYRLEGSTDITLRVYEPGVKTTAPSVQIKTLARAIETMELNEMEYEFYVEIDLSAFKNALKTAKCQKATTIQLCVYEYCKMMSGDSETEKTICFVVKYSGERTSSSFPFESRIVMSGGESGPVMIKALDGGVQEEEEEDSESVQEMLSKMSPVYQGSFLSEYLFFFVKSMDRFNITLRLATDRPLIVDYPLGCSSTDGLRYVLAPTSSID